VGLGELNMLGSDQEPSESWCDQRNENSGLHKRREISLL